MEALGKCPYTDWVNLSIDQLRSVDFPIYVTKQTPGDLVVYPTMTAYQTWNLAPLVTRVAWNILCPSSIDAFFNYFEPVYQRCHPDVGLVPLVPVHALQRALQPTMDEGGPRGRGELPKLFDIFDIFDFLFSREEVPESVPVQAVDAEGASVVCNFCGMAIWNRHMHCEACKNFDLCLTCFVFGRSCKHLTAYVLAELFPRKHLLGLYEGVKAMINTPHVCLEGTGYVLTFPPRYHRILFLFFIVSVLLPQIILTF